MKNDLRISRRWRHGRRSDPLEHILEEWMGQEDAYSEISSLLPDTAHIGESVSRVMKRAIGADKLRLVEIRKFWKEITGRDISAISDPVYFKDKILHISVDNSAWLVEMDRMKKNIVAKINARFGEGFCSGIKLKIKG